MLTKLEVSDDQLAAVLAPLGEPRTHRPLTGGMFATVLRVRLCSGEDVVVKVASADTSRFLTYERGLLGTEARIFRDLEGSGVPVPHVLLEDHSRAVLDGDVLVTALLPGSTWQDHVDDLPEEVTHAIERELGAVMAAAHRVTGDAFGYPAPEAGLVRDDWPSAVEAMVEAMLADAERFGVTLPTARVRAALARHRGALEVVVRPAVVHNDLWQGNVLLDEGFHIVGITDTERTVWADPLLDLIGSDQFGRFDVNPHVLAGNTAAGGVLAAELATPTGPVRYALYRMYFSLILVVEVTARGYEGEFGAWYESSARELLDAALERLEQLEV